MGCTLGVIGFTLSVQSHVEEAPRGAETWQAPTPEMKQPQPPSTQLVWLYWVRVAILSLDANKSFKFSSQCPKGT